MKKLLCILLCLTLACGACLLPAFAAEDKVAFLDNVAGNDTNDGLSAAAPKKTFGSLGGRGVLGLVRTGGTIVVVGKAWVAKDWTLPKADGPLTFTAAYNGTDYKDPTPAINPNTSFKMASGATLTIASDVTFDDIILFQESKQNTITVSDGATLTITDKAVLMSKPGRDYHFRIVIEAGATAILSEEAQKVMTVENSGTLKTYGAAGQPQNRFRPVRGYENQFTDVTNDKWFYPYVRTAYEYGLASGTSKTTFSPGGTFTVAEALTVAANLHSAYHGSPAPTAAGAGNWYDPFVSYCRTNGIVREGQFADCGAPISRGDMAIVFAAVLPESEYAPTREGACPDVTTDMACAAAVGKLFAAGIVGGDEKGNYHPQNEIIRAEACVIFTRMAAAEYRMK